MRLDDVTKRLARMEQEAAALAKATQSVARQAETLNQGLRELLGTDVQLGLSAHKDTLEPAGKKG